MTTNPYESPRTPPEPGEGPEMPQVTGRDAGLFVVGMLACGAITLVGAVIAAVMAAGIGGDLAALVVFLNSPAVIGPIAGVVLWAGNRQTRRPFAMGAVTFGVGAFLAVGGCLMLLAG